jgi:precorrin-2 methylase
MIGLGLGDEDDITVKGLKVPLLFDYAYYILSQPTDNRRDHIFSTDFHIKQQLLQR